MKPTAREEMVVREFWTGTGLADCFPRDIETAVALKLPLTLVKVPLVNVHAVRQWLETRRLRAAIPPEPGELMGCLVAYRGFGVAFICGADSAEEQRLTVAHEAAHFLQDYLHPRREILAALGEGIAEVLDGHRPPTFAERANAVLSHLQVGVHVHLLPRNDTRGVTESLVEAVEDRADRLGLELVAPHKRVQEAYRAESGSSRQGTNIAAALGLQFGLPSYVFSSLTAQPTQRAPISFLDDIRFALAARAARPPYGKP